MRLPRSDTEKGVVCAALLEREAGMEETATAVRLPRSDIGKEVVGACCSFVVSEVRPRMGGLPTCSTKVYATSLWCVEGELFVFLLSVK